MYTSHQNSIEETLGFTTGSTLSSTTYSAYGKQTTSGDKTTTRSYTTHQYDQDTDLLYMNQRYQSPSYGFFLSQDEVTSNLENNDITKSITGLTTQQYLHDPQGLSPYTYTRNNPVNMVDLDGRWWKEFVFEDQKWLGDNGLQNEIGESAQYLYDNSKSWNYAMDNPVKTFIGVGVVGGAAAYGAAAVLSRLSVNYLNGIGTGCIMACDKAYSTTQNAVRLLESPAAQEVKRLSTALDTSGYKFSKHAVERIVERVGTSKIGDVIKTLDSKPITYTQNGTTNLGYYNESLKTFIGQVKDSKIITTFINNVKPEYIKNLLKR